VCSRGGARHAVTRIERLSLAERESVRNLTGRPAVFLSAAGIQNMEARADDILKDRPFQAKTNSQEPKI
jgi:hypothetical protein